MTKVISISQPKSLFQTIVQKTYRVPVGVFTPSSTKMSGKLTRQLDIALMAAGFKLSGELFRRLSELHWVHVSDLGGPVLAAVKELVGDHVEHNVYFKNFPDGIPDTEEFWMDCLFDALGRPESMLRTGMQFARGAVDLVALPKYGRYRHTYDEMIATCDQYIASSRDKFKVLHLGKSLEEEAEDLYASLAGSRVPLNGDDRILLESLAEMCLHVSDVEIPVRENRAIINAVCVKYGKEPAVGTPTDILRLAAALSGGDITLEKPTKFKSFPKSQRRVMLRALNYLLATKSPVPYGDFNQYREEWKRLGERLHPFEFHLNYVNTAFEHIRKPIVRSTATMVDAALKRADVKAAVALLKPAPGILFRNLDRLIRTTDSPMDTHSVADAIRAVGNKVSGRVLLSVREHFDNRTVSGKRIFANSKGTAYVTADTRASINDGLIAEVTDAINTEIERRLPKPDILVVDPAILGVALPLSEKNKVEGFNVMPRGSVTPINCEILRFFMYWKQKAERTDYDLSCLFLDKEFKCVNQASWTSLRGDGYRHSGDIVDAPNGATEFIDIDLHRTPYSVIIPTVNFYAGETFDKCAEAFFGFMERDGWDNKSAYNVPRDWERSRHRKPSGKPFEPQAVRTKSGLTGTNRITLPLAFFKKGTQWYAKWLHLNVKGAGFANMVEKNAPSLQLTVKTMIQRQYLTVGHLVMLMVSGYTTRLIMQTEGMKYDYKSPVTYIGLERPEGLPEGSTVYTLANLKDLMPA